MKVLRWIVGTVVVVAWIAVPVAVATVLTARSERSVQSPPVTSAWMPVGDVQVEMDRKVVAVGTLGAAPPLLAPAWAGLVEQVDLRPGQPLRSGDVVAIVSGIPRLALHTSRPFHRTLGYDDQGTDVAELNTWLRARGLEASEGDRYGGATRRGVRALRRELGVPEPEPAPEPAPPTGGTGTTPAGDAGDPSGGAAPPPPTTAPAADTAGSFDPGWIVYLPRPEVTVGAVHLQVGAPVVPAGSVVAEIEADVASVHLVQPDPTSPSPPSGGAGPGNGAPPSGTDPSGTGTGGTPPPVTGSPSSTGGNVSGTPLAAAAEGSELRRNGEVLGPVAPDGSVPVETVNALLPLFEGQDSVVVDLVEPAPAGARPVPSAALFTGPTGMSCVASRARPGGEVTVAAAVPITAAVDRVVLAGLPEGPLEVEVNASPATRRRCRG